jgi:hypothetical protein
MWDPSDDPLKKPHSDLDKILFTEFFYTEKWV